MYYKRFKAKAAEGSGEGGLGPLFLVWVKSSKLFETSPDMIVKRLQRFCVEGGRDDADGIDHFGETSAPPQKLQSNLRVWDFPKSLQDTKGLVNSLLSMLVAKLTAANRATEQLKVSIPSDFKVRGKRCHVHSGSGTSGKNEFALIFTKSLTSIGDQPSTESKANSGAAGLQGLQSRQNSTCIPS